MKKQSTTKQILNILNTEGGKKPKQLIALTKASPASVYNALHILRSKKMIAKEEDGVYISQTQKEATPVSNVTNKVTLDKTRYIKSLEVQVHQLEKLHDGWRQNYKKLEDDYTQAKIMYLDSQAVIAYLEAKVARLVKE